MKLIGTWNEDHHKLFNRLAKQELSPCEIVGIFEKLKIKRVYVVPDSYNGTALDWENSRHY